MPPGSLCAQRARELLPSEQPRQPVPSVHYLEGFPEKNGAHLGVLLAWQEKGTVTARSLPRRPDLFSVPQGSRVRRESE